MQCLDVDGGRMTSNVHLVTTFVTTPRVSHNNTFLVGRLIFERSELNVLMSLLSMRGDGRYLVSYT